MAQDDNMADDPRPRGRREEEVGTVRGGAGEVYTFAFVDVGLR